MSDGRIALPRGRVLLFAALGVGAALLAVRLASEFYIDLLWFHEVGYAPTFWKLTLWGWGLRAFVFLLAGVLAFWNLRLVAKTLGVVRIRRKFGNIEISEQLPRSYVVWGVVATSVLFGLWFGAALPRGAVVEVLLALNAPDWELNEPIFGRSAGFYVFLLPMLLQGLSLALALLFLLGSICLAGYSATGSIRVARGRPELAPAAVRHMAWLAAAFLVVLAARFWLGRYFLLASGNSSVEGIFGFADANARVPALQGLTGIAILAAGAVVWGALRDQARMIVSGVLAVVTGWLLIGQMYPSLVQRFRVQPNELERETRFIEHNLDFTREGFGLTEMEERAVRFGSMDADAWSEALPQMAGLPVWSPSPLLTTFRELEARFRYYDFRSVTVDRYGPPDAPIPVTISVREVEPAGIEDRNWQNLHLRERYVAGLGAVAGLAAGATTEGGPRMLLSDIVGTTPADPVAEELELDWTAVYFGTRLQEYAIVTPTDSSFSAPDGTRGVPGVDLPVGIELDSVIRKLALAWRFRDADLLFSSEVLPESRFVFNRRVLSRLTSAAPFLSFPRDPYAVIQGGRVVWVADGYTASRTFPLSNHYAFGQTRVNYVRNSVKATVDAVTGEVRYYLLDAEDPIAVGLSRAFPGLFRSMEEMPDSLRRHLRYPRELLRLQSSVLLQYHLDSAPEFHGKQDVWAEAEQLTDDSQSSPYLPEYSIYRLPGDDAPEFLLTNVFVPAGRQNLTAMLVARSDPGRYGELILLDVPVEDQTPGPRQVEARVEQDPVISQQFSLWRQGGSRVSLGHLHLIPVGDALLYMEPVFLEAQDDAIPKLARFIISDGSRVVMTESLGEGVRALAGGGVVPTLASIDAPQSGAVSGRSALDILDEAEAALRRGDFQGFGQGLDELRRALERGSGPEGADSAVAPRHHRRPPAPEEAPAADHSLRVDVRRDRDPGLIGSEAASTFRRFRRLLAGLQPPSPCGGVALIEALPPLLRILQGRPPTRWTSTNIRRKRSSGRPACPYHRERSRPHLKRRSGSPRSTTARWWSRPRFTQEAVGKAGVASSWRRLPGRLASTPRPSWGWISVASRWRKCS